MRKIIASLLFSALLLKAGEIDYNEGNYEYYQCVKNTELFNVDDVEHVMIGLDDQQKVKWIADHQVFIKDFQKEYYSGSNKSQEYMELLVRYGSDLKRFTNVYASDGFGNEYLAVEGIQMSVSDKGAIKADYNGSEHKIDRQVLFYNEMLRHVEPVQVSLQYTVKEVKQVNDHMVIELKAKGKVSDERIDEQLLMFCRHQAQI